MCSCQCQSDPPMSETQRSTLRLRQAGMGNDRIGQAKARSVNSRNKPRRFLASKVELFWPRALRLVTLSCSSGLTECNWRGEPTQAEYALNVALSCSMTVGRSLNHGWSWRVCEKTGCLSSSFKVACSSYLMSRTSYHRCRYRRD